jgi:hypothetical protein
MRVPERVVERALLLLSLSSVGVLVAITLIIFKEGRR